MHFDLDYIEKLAKLAKDNNLEELTIEDENMLVSLRREIQHPAAAVSALESGAVIKSAQTAPVQETAPAVQAKRKTLTASMAGTFYSAPSPDEPPFVKIGDNVAAGQIVCIIEAMKLMNEIETDISGRISEICFKDGDVVSPGDVLMYVD